MKNLQSKVMKAAHKIFKKSYKNKTTANWSKALKRAWKWAKETLMQPQGVAEFRVRRETEKAVLVMGQLVCVHTDQVVNADFWCPKSLIKDNVIAQWFFDKKVAEVKELHSHYSGSLEFRLV